MQQVFFSDQLIPAINLLVVGDSKASVNHLGIINDRFSTLEHWFSETPLRFGGSGWTTLTMFEQIDALIAAATGTPDYILVNLGANDVPEIDDETYLQSTWNTRTRYWIDAIQTKYPGVPMYWTIVWRGNYDAGVAALRSWQAELLTEYSGITLGPDEYALLENGDYGATYYDEILLHPTDAGMQLEADFWIGMMGL